MYRILLVAAVHDELSGLFTLCKARQSSFVYNNWQIDTAVCGIGAVNAAATVAVTLSNGTYYDHVWMIGSCGGYGTSKGDIIIATQEINADLGIRSNNKWTSPTMFPFSIVENKWGHFVNTFPCCHYEVKTSFSFGIHYGTLLSTSCVSGDFVQATTMRKRFCAIGENMEGAAVAQVCTAHNIKFTEIRGISNIAGERNKKRWDFATAYRNLHKVILHLWETI